MSSKETVVVSWLDSLWAEKVEVMTLSNKKVEELVQKKGDR